ncbi:MAG: hypothetical protein Q7S50_01265 [bacterium]|nr:hypothetical protein [bacterium]
MSNKALIGFIVVLVVAVGAYYFATTRLKIEAPVSQGMPVLGGENSGNEMVVENDPLVNGTWKSTEDSKFTREFRADGTVVDTYEGDASATSMGTYMVVDPARETGIPVPAANLAGMTIIKTTWANGDVMYFGVNSLTESDLKLVNLSGRGNILMFTKVQ